MIKILVVCASPDILKVILRLANANRDWEAAGTASVQEAKDAMQTSAYELLLIGSGLNEADEQGLIEYVSNAHPEMRIVQHYGGGSGLLSAEIYQALA